MHILRSIYILYIYTGYILVLEKPSSTGNQMCLRTNPLTGWWNVTGQSLAGRTHSLIFCLWVSSRECHTTRKRLLSKVAISTAPAPIGDHFGSTRPIASGSRGLL